MKELSKFLFGSANEWPKAGKILPMEILAESLGTDSMDWLVKKTQSMDFYKIGILLYSIIIANIELLCTRLSFDEKKQFCVTVEDLVSILIKSKSLQREIKIYR